MDKERNSLRAINFNSIKNDWIYDNMLLTNDEGRVFQPPGYYSEETMPSYVPRYFKDLPVQIPLRDMRGVLRTIIPNINKQYSKIKYTNKDHDAFSLSKGDELSDISKGSFKIIYNFILMEKSVTIRIWEQKWRDELNKENLNWDNIWNNINEKMFNYKIQSSIWEMVHRNFISGYILRQMHKSDGICKLCKKIERQRTHIFMKCNVILQLYRYFLVLLKRCDSRDITEEEKAFGIYEQRNPNINLRNYITFVIRHIVYRNRNLTYNSGENILTIMINKVNFYIRKDLLEKFNIAKYNNEIQQFKAKYLIGEFLGKIRNNEIEITVN